MTTAVQHRRGTTAEHATFTGLEGELTIDTTKDTAVIHDGALAGGYPLAKENLANVNPTTLSTIDGASTASDDKFLIWDQSALSMKSITRAELNNAIEQDALSNVAITGGSINGTTIGASTPTTGAFTTLSATGTTTLTTVDINGGNIDGTAIGASSASTGAFTTLAASGAVTLSGATANGVVYANGSKVLTTGSGLQFDGANLGIGTSSPSYPLDVSGTSQIGIRYTNTGATSTARIYVTCGTATGILQQHGESHATNANELRIASTGALTLQTAGSVKATLDSSGNLGLGVTPSAWGTASAYRAIDIGSGSALANMASTTTTDLISNAYYNGTNWLYKNTAAASKYRQSSGAHSWDVASSGTAGSAISFTQAMTLDASGRLALGTTTANEILNIYSSANTYIGLYNSISGTTSSDGGYLGLSGTNLEVRNKESGNLTLWTANAERLRIDSSGNVGIGTTAPQNALHVAAADATLRLTTTSDTGEAGIELWDNQNGTSQTAAIRFDDTNNQFTIQGNANGTIFLTPSNTFPSGSEAMRIDSSGNVGIGTSSPTSRLHVSTSSTSLAQFTGPQYGQIRHSDGTRVLYTQVYDNQARIFTESATPLLFGTSNAERMRLDSSGNLGLGVTPSASTSGTYKGLYVGHTLVKGAPSAATASFASNCDIANNYIYTGYASRYDQGGGAHYWNIAPSGTAGSAISFTQAMTLDASGRLGIGTTSPGAALEVNASIDTKVLLTHQNFSTRKSFIGSNAGSSASYNALIFGSNSTDKGTQANTALSSWYQELGSFTANGDAWKVLYQAAGGAVTERARIDSSGNLGIGTSSPTSFGAGYTTLTLSGSNSGIFQSKNTLGDTRVYANTSGEALVGSWANTALKLYTNSTLQATIDSSGNLGLGVTPSAWGSGKGFEFGFNGNAVWSYSQTDSYFTHNAKFTDSWRYAATAAASSYRQSAGAHYWNIAPSGTAGNAISFTQAMTLDASGNLLVGTTSGSARVNIDSGTNRDAMNIASTSSGYSNIVINRNTASGAYVFFVYNGSGVGSITTNGTSTTYGTSSDYRLKENIQPMTGALAKVAALKPCTYKWKADGSDGEGFIAHELAEVVPQCVTGEKDAVDAEGNPVYQGIDTSFLIATLTAALQEQQAQIEQLRAEIQTLKGN